MNTFRAGGHETKILNVPYQLMVSVKHFLVMSHIHTHQQIILFIKRNQVLILIRKYRIKNKKISNNGDMDYVDPLFSILNKRDALSRVKHIQKKYDIVGRMLFLDLLTKHTPTIEFLAIYNSKLDMCVVYEEHFPGLMEVFLASVSGTKPTIITGLFSSALDDVNYPAHCHDKEK